MPSIGREGGRENRLHFTASGPQVALKGQIGNTKGSIVVTLCCPWQLSTPTPYRDSLLPSGSLLSTDLQTLGQAGGGGEGAGGWKHFVYVLSDGVVALGLPVARGQWVIVVAGCSSIAVQ